MGEKKRRRGDVYTSCSPRHHLSTMTSHGGQTTFSSVSFGSGFGGFALFPFLAGGIAGMGS